MHDINSYIPQDRRQALTAGKDMPDRMTGSALIADISGFTPLAAVLVQTLGARRGAEELSRQLNLVYDAAIGEVERYGGSVISFAGDAITCWFVETEPGEENSPVLTPSSAVRALACAQAMQAALRAISHIDDPSSKTATGAMKVAIASGPVRRFAAGDPDIQRLDILAGNTLNRMAAGEQLAQTGEIITDELTVAHAGNAVQVSEWRTGETGSRYAVITHIEAPPVQPDCTQETITVLPDELARPWLLPRVYEQIQAGGGDFLSELRRVVAVFLRFTGIDYDNDDAAGEKLDAYLRWVQRVLRSEEGILSNVIMGDKGSYLFAVFGALAAHEDDARRAVSAALKLRRPPASLGILSSTQVGISQGMMWVGSCGSCTRRTYSALGDEANLASRLMQAAAPGQILVSSFVYSDCRAAFHWNAFDTIKVKGIDKLVPVCTPLEPAHQHSLRLLDAVYTTPMVGRQAELAAATQKMDMVFQGQGQILGITGEAGLGKSRLMAEIIRSARTKGFVAYGGECLSEGENTPYLVWRTIWSDIFGLDSAASPTEQMRMLEQKILDLAPQRINALPLLGILLSLPLPENRFTHSLEPKLRKSALHALLEDCLKAVAHQAPLLLALEDLQSIDPLSNDLLEEMGRVITRHPVMVILAYRPHSPAPQVENLPGYTRLALTELSVGERAQMIHIKLAQLYPGRDGAASPDLIEQIALRSQGNPFYLEELVNDLFSRGVDLYASTFPNLPVSDLPDSLHALILSRIDRLSEHEKITLKVASVIGREFRLAWLAGCYPALGNREQIVAGLEALRRQDILLLDTSEPRGMYLFKHVVTQDVVYDSMPYATRALLHEAFAVYLEADMAAAPPLDLLAYHYERSDNIPKQIYYLRRAGEAAQAAYANAAAIAYYTRLLPLLAAKPDEHIRTSMKLGSITELLGQWEQAEQHYTAGLELAERLGSEVQMGYCRLALGTLQNRRGRYGEALVWLEQARSGFERLGEKRGLSLALAEAGMVFYRQADFTTANDLLQNSLSLARSGERTDEALALKNLGNVAWRMGQYPQARTLYAESLALYRKIGDKEGIATLLNNLGNVADDEGNYPAARALYEESLALHREIGNKKGISMVINNLGFMAWAQGDLTAARALHLEALALEQEMGEKWGIALSLNNLGSVAAEQGDYLAARSYYEQGLALSQEIGTKLDMALGWSNLGEIAAAQKEYLLARELYEKSILLAQEAAYNRLVAYNLILLAEVTLHIPMPGRRQSPLQSAQRATRFLAAASTALEGLGARLNRVEQRAFARSQAAVEAALGEAGFRSVWEEGTGLTLEQAVALARAEIRPGAARRRDPRNRSAR